jgi:hypothetical protein
VPHIASDRRIHGLAVAPPSVVRGAPPRGVCPPSAVNLLAAQASPISLIHFGIGLPGGDPDSGSGRTPRASPVLSLRHKSLGAMQNANWSVDGAGIQVDRVENAAGWCASRVYPSVRLSVSPVRAGHRCVVLSVCLCPVLVRLSVFRAIPDMRTLSGQSLYRPLSVSFLSFTWHDARNGQSDS